MVGISSSGADRPLAPVKYFPGDVCSRFSAIAPVGGALRQEGIDAFGCVLEL
jgi:hypothetical protein